MSSSHSIVEVCKDIEHLLTKPLDSPDAAFELAEEVENHPEGIQAVALLLLLLERNPDVDWGAPGTLVHAVETFFKSGYEPLLLESVLRCPTSHTLWMVNRIINGVPKNQQEQYLSAMRAAAGRSDVPHEVRERANHFLEFQGDQE